MKVKELIERLQKFDPELDIFCTVDGYDSGAISEVFNVYMAEGERCRIDDAPYLKFNSRSILLYSLLVFLLRLEFLHLEVLNNVPPF